MIIHIQTEEEIRAMIREEIKAIQPRKAFETITQAEALQMFKSNNLPPKRRGYITLKRIISEGKIKTTGRRVSKSDVQDYINTQLLK